MSISTELLFVRLMLILEQSELGKTLSEHVFVVDADAKILQGACVDGARSGIRKKAWFDGNVRDLSLVFCEDTSQGGAMGQVSFLIARLLLVIRDQT